MYECDYCYTELEVVEESDAEVVYSCANSDCKHSHPELNESDYGYVGVEIPVIRVVK